MEVSEIIDEIFKLIDTAEQDTSIISDKAWNIYVNPIKGLVADLELEIC